MKWILADTKKAVINVFFLAGIATICPVFAGCSSEQIPVMPTVETEGVLDASAKSDTETAETKRTTEVSEATSEATAFTEGENRTSEGRLVVIDPGHQLNANNDTEAIGPGSLETKAKVSSGTEGVASGVPEYVLNLEVSLKLRNELENRGYKVVMTRETHDVDVSNSQRAAIANDLNADAFVRIHANSVEDSALNGCITMCHTPKNIFNGDLYYRSRYLSDCVLDEFCKVTGARSVYVWETDTMTGMNWSKVPVTTVEMGFMSNPEEDLRMQDEAYQEKMVQGIANGIDSFFGVR